jgi:hypothetical protein
MDDKSKSTIMSFLRKHGGAHFPTTEMLLICYEGYKNDLTEEPKPVKIPENFPVKGWDEGGEHQKIFGFYDEYSNGKYHMKGVGNGYFKYIEPDWEMVWRLLNAPDWANWLACDKSGTWYFYGSKPEYVGGYNTLQVMDGVGDQKAEPFHRFIPFTDWKNSLSKRPDNL